jgi:hypothetical protein
MIQNRQIKNATLSVDGHDYGSFFFRYRFLLLIDKIKSAVCMSVYNIRHIFRKRPAKTNAVKKNVSSHDTPYCLPYFFLALQVPFSDEGYSSAGVAGRDRDRQPVRDLFFH